MSLDTTNVPNGWDNIWTEALLHRIENVEKNIKKGLKDRGWRHPRLEMAPGYLIQYSGDEWRKIIDTDFVYNIEELDGKQQIS